ncbi:MAG: histidine triad nucleotide-binding protein [Chlorobi bacterium]|nr:histidine triad nucleotide-binding protein [Chlorobiota bacterium]
MSDTIFAKIIRKEIPAEIVYEDEQVLAFRDINPQGPTHVLVIPKEEIATANDIIGDHEQLVGHMVTTAVQIAKEEGIADDGYRLVMNCNPEGGQEVYHIHLHLIGGRQMEWPPG